MKIVPTKKPPKHQSESRITFGFVYAIYCERFDSIKIGVARDVEKRMAGIFSTKVPAKLELVHKIEVRYPYKIEKKLHDRFAEFHDEGEWYKIDKQTAKDALEDYMDDVSRLHVRLSKALKMSAKRKRIIEEQEREILRLKALLSNEPILKVIAKDTQSKIASDDISEIIKVNLERQINRCWESRKIMRSSDVIRNIIYQKTKRLKDATEMRQIITAEFRTLINRLIESGHLEAKKANTSWRILKPLTSEWVINS